MIKFRELSNFSNVKTFPNIKAHVDMDNYRVVIADQANEVTSFGTVQAPGQDLCVVMQWLYQRTGDLFFGQRGVKQGERTLCVGLESLATRFLDVGAQHITGGLDADGALTVVAGDALIPDGTGNWVVGAVPTAGVYLLVTGFTTLPFHGNEGKGPMTEPAVIAQIISL